MQSADTLARSFPWDAVEVVVPEDIYNFTIVDLVRGTESLSLRANANQLLRARKAHARPGVQAALCAKEMSSASSTASWQNKQRDIDMDSNQSRLEQAERALEHQQSSGNLLLRSIDAEWLEAHKELLDIFIQNPNDPAILDQVIFS